MADTGFTGVVSDVAALRELYGEPSMVVQNKSTSKLDEPTTSFIAASRFLLVGTTAADGTADVSPRGGPAGFVRVLDDHRLVIPDLNGNRRIDTLRNIAENPQVGLLFLVPGNGETLRVNGRAVVSTDEQLLSMFDDEFRRPQSAIGVEVDEVFLHCAKSIRRSSLWEPEGWVAEPLSPGEILVAALGTDAGFTAAQVDEGLADGYTHELALDRPETSA